MTHSDAEDTLILEFLNNLPTYNGVQIDSSRVMTPNAPFTNNNNKSWIRVGVYWDKASQLEAGHLGLDVTEGTLVFDIFVPQNSGNKEYKEIQNQIIEHFNKKRFGGCVDVYDVFPNNIGQQDSLFHYQIQFTCRITF